MSLNGGSVNKYFTEVEDPSESNFKVFNDFNDDELESVSERKFETPLHLNFGPMWRIVLLDEIHVDGAKEAFKNAIIFSFLSVITDGDVRRTTSSSQEYAIPFFHWSSDATPLQIFSVHWKGCFLKRLHGCQI